MSSILTKYSPNVILRQSTLISVSIHNEYRITKALQVQW